MILTQYLKKLGLTSYEQLNEEEKKTYREWELALSGRKLTEPEVRQFLEQEVEEAVEKLTSLPLNERDDIFLKMKIEFIRRLVGFLDAPIKEKGALEAALKAQL